MEQTKKCPMCAEEIPLLAVTCEYCGAQFIVTSTGYCQICHEVREADDNGKCKVCGNAVVDLRVESRLIEGPAQEPFPASQPIAQSEITKPKINYLPIGILVGILIFAVIGAFLWSGRKDLPAASSPAATPTAIPTATPTSTPDPRKLNPTNQHLYLYVKENKSWQSAAEYCSAQGGYLITIQDEIENQYIYQLTHGKTWLGATDEFKEGTWIWVSSEPWQYTNWRSGQPDNNYQTENYLTYYEAKPSWNDVGDFKMFFVCEWESTSP